MILESGSQVTIQVGPQGAKDNDYIFTINIKAIR